MHCIIQILLLWFRLESDSTYLTQHGRGALWWTSLQVGYFRAQPLHGVMLPGPSQAALQLVVVNAGMVFFADLVLGFHTGYVVTFNFKRKVVMDGRLVAKFYVLRGTFVVDFLSTCAWITQVGRPVQCMITINCIIMNMMII